MALFGNKVEICIVFVGKHSQQVNALQEKAIINTYHARLKSLIHLHYPGLSRYHSWFFSDWSSQAYSIYTAQGEGRGV